MKRFLVGLLVFVLTAGCATSMKMSMSKAELGQLQQNEGIVFGSVLLIKGPRSTTADSDAADAGGKSWTFYITDAEKAKTFTKYGITAGAPLKTREGVETPFVTKLAAGEYVFLNAESSVFMGTITLPLGVRFGVSQGKTTYIGRLVVEMPEKMDIKVLGLPAGTHYRASVEDVQESTTTALASDYAEILKDVNKELMHLMQP